MIVVIRGEDGRVDEAGRAAIFVHLWAIVIQRQDTGTRTEPARADAEVELVARLSMRPAVGRDVFAPRVGIEALRIVDGKREEQLMAAMR